MLFVADRPKNAGIKILSKTNRTSEPGLYPDPVFLPGSGSGSGFGSGSGSRFQIYLDPDPVFQISLDPDPDPVFKILWILIRIRFSNLSGPRSGFRPRRKKRNAERALKVIY